LFLLHYTRTHTLYINKYTCARARVYRVRLFFYSSMTRDCRRHKNRCVRAYPLKSGFCRVPCSTRARPDIVSSIIIYSRPSAFRFARVARARPSAPTGVRSAPIKRYRLHTHSTKCTFGRHSCIARETKPPHIIQYNIQ